MCWSVKAADSKGHLAKAIEGPLDFFNFNCRVVFLVFYFHEGILESI